MRLRGGVNGCVGGNVYVGIEVGVFEKVILSCFNFRRSGVVVLMLFCDFDVFVFLGRGIE